MITLAARSQQLSGRHLVSRAEVVAHLGALQAQNWAGCKWAASIRVARAVTDSEIERAIDEGTWQRTVTRKAASITLELFDKPKRVHRAALGEAAARYAAFHGLGLDLSFARAESTA